MSEPNRTDFVFVNREGQWHGVHWKGLEVDAGGRLVLQQLPRRLTHGAGADVSPRGPEGAFGLAIDDDRTIYFAAPAQRAVFRSGGCADAPGPIRCSSESGPTALLSPRGIWIGARRRALYVADSAAHRVVAIDLDEFRCVEFSGRGVVDTPTALVGDSGGQLYVVDATRGRVVKIDRFGAIDAQFASNIEEARIRQPLDIALDAEAGGRLFVIDGASRDVVVVTPDGRPVRDAAEQPLRFGSADLRRPLGIAATDGQVFVGDNERRRIVVFTRRQHQYEFTGEAVDYSGPVAGLALDRTGSLYVNAGDGAAPIALSVRGGHARNGVFWSDPIQPRASKVVWHRLRADLDLPPGAHAEFFFAQGEADSPPPVASLAANGGPFADPRWRSVPRELDEFFIGGDPSSALWIGGQFIGNGASTPALSQVRVEYDHKSYAAYLPAIYRRPNAAGDTLVRVLSLFESFFNEPEGEVDRLPALFDPNAVPERFAGWLAGWLDITLDESWSLERKRRAIAVAFRGYARRGTPEQLRETINERLGIEVAISEPLQAASCWSLPAPVQRCADDGATTDDDPQWQATSLSVLGMSTMLAPSSPQGAVVGTTAVLDRSPLIEGDAFGEPLFDDLAYQFAVLVHRGELRGDGALDRLRWVVDEERPVHTACHVCVIEPRMRVGFQARVGIDTVVAGPPRSIRADESALDGSAAVGGHPAGRIGQQTMVGINTRLG